MCSASSLHVRRMVVRVVRKPLVSISDSRRARLEPHWPPEIIDFPNGAKPSRAPRGPVNLGQRACVCFLQFAARFAMEIADYHIQWWEMFGRALSDHPPLALQRGRLIVALHRVLPPNGAPFCPLKFTNHYLGRHLQHRL